MWGVSAGIARHRGFACLTHSKSQSCIVVTSAAAHGRIVKTVKKVTTYMVGTVKRQNTSSSERSWRKIAATRQSSFRKSAWSGYAHKMCAVDSNTKHLYSNEMSDRATHFTVFMIMNCPVEQQILAAYGSIVDSRRTFPRVSLYLNYSFRKLRMPPKRMVSVALKNYINLYFIAGKWFKCCSILRSNKVFQHSKCEEICWLLLTLLERHIKTHKGT